MLKYFYLSFIVSFLPSLSIGQTINQAISTTKNQYDQEKSISKKATLAADLAWYYSQVNADSALYYGRKSLHLSESTGDSTLIAQSLNDLATVYLVKGSYKKSIEYCDKGLIIRKKLDDQKGIASLYFKKGNAFNKMQVFDSTMFYYFKAHDLYVQTGDSAVIANIEANISSAYFLMGNYKKALKYIHGPIDFYKRNDEYYLLANSTLNLGSIQLALKDTTHAINSFETAIHYSNMSNNASTMAASYNNLSNVFMARKEFEQAVKTIEKGIEIRQKMGLDADLESSWLTLANAKLAMGDYSTAKGFFYQVKASFEQIEAKDKLKEIYLGLSFIYAAEKNKDSLNYYTTLYSETLQSIYNEEQLKRSQEIEAKYQTERKELELTKAKNKNLIHESEIRQKNSIILGSTLLLVFFGLISFLVYKQQKAKTIQLEREHELRQVLSAIEVQNRLHEQRLEISRELHDNIGSQLTFIVSSIENFKNYRLSEEAMNKEYGQLSEFTRTTIAELRDSIWAMNKEEISFEDLKTRTLNFIGNAQLYAKGIQFDFSCPDQNQTNGFTSSMGITLYRIIQEAVNNAVKHASPTSISVIINDETDKLSIKIQDNGKGFDTDQTTDGNGLYSMQKRAYDIGGELSVTCLNGTIITLTVPKISVV